MISIIYFLCGYLLIGVVVAHWLIKKTKQEDIPLPKEATENEAFVILTLTWGAFVIVALFFPKILEERK